MKISILIPTRDRLTLLRRAVDSVLRLEEPDCEIVVSDNASEQDVGAWVDSLGDPRIVYTRTPESVPVTENWNNALAHSSGDYLIMLGDDDALLDGYFSRVRDLLGRFQRPQVIYHNALVYAYPGVVPEEPGGFLRSEGYAEFLREAHDPFLLDKATRSAMVSAAIGFRVRYGFNMQFVTIARSIVQELSADGPFFRSPFPDYFAMNRLFLRAHTILADPQPAVVIGVSPRSYGFFHNNRQETEGRSFLQAGREERHAGPALLPGTNINDGWLEAMSELHAAEGSTPPPDYRRYRRLQIAYVYEGRYLRGTIGERERRQLARMLSPSERLLFGAAFHALAVIARLLPERGRARIPAVLQLLQRQFPAWDPIRDESSYEDIGAVVAMVDPTREPLRWQQPRRSGLRARLVARLG
ncbi:MAG TPA: glycosyltransferase family 2 protein [Solirubrobacteraceae bacterium]|nr:glycosyltransferase family 2 protein [Solirubrobacteraceae bacterium]